MSNSNKTWLTPVIFRRGAPVISYVKRYSGDGKVSYRLGMFYAMNIRRKSRVGSGLGNDYEGCSETVISKDLYDAYVRESKANHKKYVITPEMRRIQKAAERKLLSDYKRKENAKA